MTLFTSILALGLILGLGNQFGERAAGCYGAITTAPTNDKNAPKPTPAIKPGQMHVLEKPSREGEKGLDTENGIPQDSIEQ